MSIEILPPAPKPIALRTVVLISSLFWAYVTLSNVFYAANMQAVANMYHANMFSPWEVRVVQHLLLLPLLLLCYWASTRAGWEIPRGLGLQLMLAAGFAVLCDPAMQLSMHLCSWFALHQWHPPVFGDEPDDSDHLVWNASFISFLLTYGFGVALISGFNSYQRYRDSELRGAALERVWTTARLTALRMQLSPHTLFNLLHTIRGQINPEPEIARSMVVQLAELLRRLLGASQRDFSLLTDELGFARMYFELQQQRFGDRLTVSLPDTGAQPALWVPSLILQPLVENAVLHGLAGHDGPVEIRLEVRPSADRLVIRVVNTTASLAVPAREGIGLSNVRERLAVQFGSQASLDARRDGPASWIAEISMPALLERAAPVAGRAAA